jgi:hypothetical protein
MNRKFAPMLLGAVFVYFVLLWVNRAYLLPTYPLVGSLLAILSPFVLAFFLIFSFSYLLNETALRRRLAQIGVRSKGTIQKIEDTGTTVNQQPMVRLEIVVTPSGQSSFTVTKEVVVSRVAIPRVGDEVPVVYDPNKRTDLVLERK